MAHSVFLLTLGRFVSCALRYALLPPENKAQRKKGHLRVEIKNHFRDSHLKFFDNSQHLLNFLFQL